MGMYTQFRGEWKLKPVLEDKIIQALSWITNVIPRQEDSYFHYPHAKTLFDDSGFWQSERHCNLGLDLNSSNHDDGKWEHTPLPIQGLSFNELYLNDKKEYYHLVVSCNCKNYDSQIEKFIKWVHQFELDEQYKLIGVLYYEGSDCISLMYNNGESKT
jgi:hypothetical protein